MQEYPIIRHYCVSDVLRALKAQIKYISFLAVIKIQKRDVDMLVSKGRVWQRD